MQAFDVQLSVQNALPSIQLCWDKKEAAISKEQIESLEEVFERNLQYSGRVDITSFSKRKVLLMMDGRAFKVSLDGEEIYSGIVSGYRERDELMIHSATDILVRALTGLEGVANTAIIYTQKNDEVSKMVRMNADGGNKKVIVDRNSLIVTPSAWPNGQGCFFVCYKTGLAKIRSLSFQKMEEIPLLRLKGNQMMPSYNFKMDEIAFISDIAGNPDLFVTKGGSLPEQILSGQGVVHSSPSFHPDGSSLAVVSNQDGIPRIYIVDLSTKKSHLLTHFYQETTAPAWSPDGTKIAFTARIGKHRQICVYDCLIDRIFELTSGPGSKENPTWAQDSYNLAYNQTLDGACEIFRINIGTKIPRQLTFGGGENRYPTWVRTQR